jgi:putative transposase
VVRDLLAGLRDRGLDTTRPILVIIDEAKALRRAVTDVFDHPVVQRYQLHKLRNVSDRLPDALASTVAKRMRRAYHHPDPWWPRPSSRRWPASWTAPTPAPPHPCAKG